ncbi:MAG: hypothetical protein JST00_32980 [Deltaproteobacteria bacterium]|nr:hypothetical protein [Deltaproteobacteria bacterium]
MRRAVFLVVTLALTLATGCGARVQAKAAPGFVELKGDPDYAFRAVAPEGVAVAARLVKLDEPMEVSFWERAVALRMRELEGYALVETKNVTAHDGLSGRELIFGHDEQGKPFVYRVRLFTRETKLLVVEAGGAKEQMDRFAPQVDWMLGAVAVP